MIPRVVRMLVVATPTVLTMWALYAMEYYKVWVPETPSRDVITVAMLGTAMTVSFLIYTRLKR